MKRRGFLGTILAAPVAGQAAVSGAMMDPEGPVSISNVVGRNVIASEIMELRRVLGDEKEMRARAKEDVDFHDLEIRNENVKGLKSVSAPYKAMMVRENAIAMSMRRNRTWMQRQLDRLLGGEI